jgi:hypothetical protein
VPRRWRLSRAGRPTWVPKRAGDRLREGLRDHVEAIGALARSALETYAGGRRAGDLAARLRGLQGPRATHATLLGEALREPGERGERAVTLRQELSAAGEVVDEVATLAAVAEESADGRVPD